MADDPQRHRDADDVPEETLAARPLAAAPQDDARTSAAEAIRLALPKIDSANGRCQRPADDGVGQKASPSDRYSTLVSQ